jgi:uncharacterized oligopeptide transporter (OPT) family protein
MARLMAAPSAHLLHNVTPFCIVSGLIAALLPLLHLLFPKIEKFLPSGIAFAIGMYVTPNWTLPRVVGALVALIWEKRARDTYGKYMIVVASGFVLGEGLLSIFTAILKSAKVPVWK